MARALRMEEPGAHYHVVARGTERRDIFTGDQEREKFLSLVGHLLEKYGVEVKAYVLMDNHYHLLIKLQRTNLSRAMQWLNVSYGVWFNRQHRRVGPLFQGRYKSVLIAESQRLWEISRYLHLNPVRTRKFGLGKVQRKRKERGLGEVPSEDKIREGLNQLRNYQWSSYRAYVGRERGREWLNVELVKKKMRKEYQSYVEEGIRLGMPESPWVGMVVEGCLGGRKKLEELRSKLVGDRREQKAVRDGEGLKEWEEIQAAVEKVWGLDWKQICQRHGDMGRDIGLLMGRQCSGMTLEELGQRAGGITYAAAYEAIRRMEQRATKERVVKEKIKVIRQLLNIEI
jgi:putative transposase